MKYVNAPHNEHHAIEDQAREIRAGYLEVREELKANNEGRKPAGTSGILSTPSGGIAPTKQ